jgi:hypothetical protein
MGGAFIETIVDLRVQLEAGLKAQSEGNNSKR